MPVFLGLSKFTGLIESRIAAIFKNVPTTNNIYNDIKTGPVFVATFCLFFSTHSLNQSICSGFENWTRKNHLAFYNSPIINCKVVSFGMFSCWTCHAEIEAVIKSFPMKKNAPTEWPLLCSSYNNYHQPEYEISHQWKRASTGLVQFL